MRRPRGYRWWEKRARVPAPVAFVLKGYPRLSETFIAQEIRALEQRGLDIRLFALRLPTDPAIHPIHREIKAPVAYLPEYLHEQPLRVLRSWRKVRRLPGWRSAWRAFRADLKRDISRNRLRRFGQAMVLAAELPPDVGWLHAHFLHTPASVVRYAARLVGLPWSASAHAKDVWTTPAWDLGEKIKECRWLVTCTKLNARFLTMLAPATDRVTLLYHGLDLDRFPPPVGRRRPRDGGNPADPVVLLSVGRAVAKKGLGCLLSALALLPADLAWSFVHIGGGPLLADLKRQATRLGIAGRIEWRGALPQQEVRRAYRAADLFVLPCRIAEDGDRDGLPNVLMEAQSQGLVCVSTEVSAIPELIINGETGILVPADDTKALSRALDLLIRSPGDRERLGSAGMRRVRRYFSADRDIGWLAARFGIEEQPILTCASPSTPR
jgi:glycosyltransferase involved in cell wall biosynthesis